jgi:hypothetical protein
VMAGASPFYRGRKKVGARGFNGRRSMPGLEDTSYLEKTSVTQSEEGGRFKAELRRLIVEAPQWHGKERGGMTAMARWHAGGAALGRLGDGEREEGKGGARPARLDRPAESDWSAGPDGHWAGGKKRK